MLKRIHVFALSSLGKGLSGGDRIYIEMSRRWSETMPVSVYIWEEGKAMCDRERLTGKYLEFVLITVGQLKEFGFVFTYFYRIFLGIKLGLTLKIDNNTLLYSASEFWMDVFPALLLKIRNPKTKWVATWYQTAPNPIVGFKEGDRKNSYRFKALLYWLVQQPIKPLIVLCADFVIVNNQDEIKQFPSMERKNQVTVLIGAVNTKLIKSYIAKHPTKLSKKKYLAVFQGRFHPQKGVVELIEIWNLVVKKNKSAKLAMIGDGPLMNEVRQKIKEFKLEKNVDLLGYISDGDNKFNVFEDSLVVVHPSFYDSGGMAAAEAMTFGLPCIGFDLKSYNSYYPKGMLKVPAGDLKAFSEMILKLSKDKKIVRKIGLEAQNMIFKNYSWDNRAKEILNKIW